MRIAYSIAVISLIAVASCSRSPQRQYEFALPSTAGLKDRAPITFRGIQVGYLTNIRLSSSGPAGVVATGCITDSRMHLLNGDTARVITVALLADPQIEIVRASDSGPELPVGSKVVAVPLPSAISVFTDILDLASELRRLPPEKQKQVAQQIRAIIDEARADSKSTGTDSR